MSHTSFITHLNGAVSSNVGAKVNIDETLFSDWAQRGRHAKEILMWHSAEKGQKRVKRSERAPSPSENIWDGWIVTRTQSNHHSVGASRFLKNCEPSHDFEGHLCHNWFLSHMSSFKWYLARHIVLIWLRTLSCSGITRAWYYIYIQSPKEKSWHKVAWINKILNWINPLRVHGMVHHLCEYTLVWW